MKNLKFKRLGRFSGKKTNLISFIIILCVVSSFNFYTVSGQLQMQIPSIIVYEQNELSPTLPDGEEEESSEIPEDALPVLALDMHPEGGEGYLKAGNVMVKNGTTNLTPNVESLFNAGLNLSFAESGPKILIVHTHASEAYMQTDRDYYIPSDPSRTQNMDYTVMRVGKEMMEVLNSMGIETIQDRSVHDYPSYNGSYKSALASIEKYLAEYPSIKVVIDVHRDAMERADGTRLKNVTEIDGEKVAQVMIVTGTNDMGLEHPYWQENLKFAMHWQNKINEMFPRLTRAIDLRTERFNTHATTGSLLIEVGSVATTLDEAIRGGKNAAKALGELLQR